jgi:hypothetical protein
MIRTGQRGDYSWLVSTTRIPAFTDLIIRSHLGLRLCISSFDSGPLRLTDDELAVGWTMQGTVAVSPSLNTVLEIPYDCFDEWYILNSPEVIGDVKVFVNYVGFSLSASPGDFGDSADLRSWFWEQLERIRPESYVAMGDNDIVVSRNRLLVQAVLAAAEPGAAADRGNGVGLPEA